MAHKVIDRCKETTSTTGTGTLTLTGAVTNFVAMADATAGLTVDGDTSWFCAENGAEWEVFLGTRVDATHLARTTVISSSNAGAAVSFTAAPTVFSTVPAKRMLPAAFNAYRASSSQSITASTYIKVQLNAEAFDTHAAFDSTTNYRFTAPVAGIYRFEWAVSGGGTSTTIVVSGLYKNGAKILAGSEGAAVGAYSEGVSVGSTTIQLAASDYIELFAFITATSPVVRITDTFLSGSLVVPLG